MITMQTFQLKIIKQALILITLKNITPYIMLMFSSRHIQQQHDNNTQKKMNSKNMALGWMCKQKKSI